MSPNAEIVQPAPQVADGDGTAKKLRVLSRGECVELLSSHGLGRLAFAVGRQAKILPVNYLLDGDSVVVRTGHGFKQAEAPMRDVAFEVDAAGADGVWGWSVVVTGVCFDVTRCLDTTSERERELPIRPWAPGQRDQWLRITTKQISGRAFGSPPELAATAHRRCLIGEPVMPIPFGGGRGPSSTSQFFHREKDSTMVAPTNERLIGASVTEQETFEALVTHERDEEEVIAGYESLATETRSEVVRYLIGLILEDERRHHRVLEQLANTIRFQATFDDRGTHLPYLDVHRSRDRALLDQTRRFRAVERRDRAQLKHLAKSVRASGGEHEAFVVDLLRSDTERHLVILRFIEHLVRRSPLS